MLAAAVRIDTVGEVEIGAIVLGENRFGCVVVENGGDRRFVLIILNIDIQWLEVMLFEPVGRIEC